MNLAIDLLGEYSDKTADRVEKLENQIDQYEDALGTYLVKLSGRELIKKTAGFYPYCFTVSVTLSGFLIMP